MRQRILLDSDTISLLRRGHERVTQHTSDYITIYGKLTFYKRGTPRTIEEKHHATRYHRHRRTR